MHSRETKKKKNDNLVIHRHNLWRMIPTNEKACRPNQFSIGLGIFISNWRAAVVVVDAPSHDPIKSTAVNKRKFSSFSVSKSYLASADLKNYYGFERSK